MLSLILSLTLCMSVIQPTNAKDSKLYPSLVEYIQKIKANTLDVNEERKAKLNELVEAIRMAKEKNGKVEVTYICTHNSRRSHMAQLITQALAYHFGIENYFSYSGGSEATAFNPRAVAALEKAGFKITSDNALENPLYTVSFGEDLPVSENFSKIYDDSSNPQSAFIAVMVCSSADKNCPIVYGAAKRIAIPYEDPKVADNTDKEAATYDARLEQIATEMYYVFNALK